MKIIYLSQAHIPSRQANSIHIMRMCEAFAQNGHEVTLVAVDSRDQSSQELDDYQFYGVKPIFNLKKISVQKGVSGRNKLAVESLFQVIKMNPDLVYGRFLLGCVLAAKIARKMVIYEIHAPKTSASESRYFNFLTRSRYLFGIVVISHALKRHYVNHKSIDESRIIVAPDGANIQPSHLTAAKLPSLTREPTFHVGYFGHLYPGKGMELLVHLIRLCPWASFHIFGGQQKDIELWSSQLQCFSNVKFYGFISPNEVARYEFACDVLLAPYQREVFGHGKVKKENSISEWMSPLKLFEYMSLGKSIVCSDLPVLREVMTNRENCLMCNPEQPMEWAAALKELRDQPELRSLLGSRAKMDLERQYTWQMRAQFVLANFAKAKDNS